MRCTVDWDRLIDDIAKMKLNMYDLALYTPEGVRVHRFQPCNRCNNCYSVAKLFVMTAVGMLWDDGLLEMTDPLEKHFRFPARIHPGWHLATVEHAMRHTLGFSQGFLDIDVEDMTRYPTDDYLSMIFQKPLDYVPGTHHQYSDAAFYLLCRLVDHVSGERMDRLLYRRLFRPMGFGEVAWSRCPKDYPLGATGLYMSAEDVLRLAVLFLHGGEYEGQRIVSSEWVRRAIAREYEFSVLGPGGLIGKGGMYGQMCAFSREQHFAIAWHGHMDDACGERLVSYLDELRA